MKKRLADWVVKRRVLIVIVSTLLLIPSFIGMIATYVNYDILSYLPSDLESKQGEQLLENDFNLASTAMVTVKNMPTNELMQLKNDIEAVDGVDRVIWQDDLLDVTVPPEILPDMITDIYYRDDATLMLVTFKGKSASTQTLGAIENIEKILKKDCFIGGMSAIIQDTKALTESEMPIYVAVAGVLTLIVLLLGVKSWLVPFIFLLGIVYPIVYNLGSNYFLGQVSYITKALVAVLQLGVTMDFSIFLLHRYDEECDRGIARDQAMSNAIQLTFSSITGSSLTTIAGFLAMCTMTLTLGTDIGLVMAKGVLLGVISTVTILPAMLMFFDGPIHRHTHKVLIPSLKKLGVRIVKHRWVWLCAFMVLLVPFSLAQQRTEVYYTLTDSLPGDMPGVAGTNMLKDTFNMTTTHFVFVSDDVKSGEMQDMMDEIEGLDGIEGVLGVEKITGAGIPDTFIPDNIKEIVQKAGYKMFVVNTSVKCATDAMAQQLSDINAIVKRYDSGAIVTGEGAMTDDLVSISSIDFNNVNVTSMALVFLIIALVFRSFSIPVLLVAVIEGAIMINMGVPYFTGTRIPFIASIVIGTIQLGATVDYAILMTTRFREEMNNRLNAKDAATTAVRTCSQSIITSALTFFAVTLGVAVVSRIELISGLCHMIARGALISMVVILLVLPAVLIVFNKIIAHTTWHWIEKPKGAATDADANPRGKEANG